MWPLRGASERDALGVWGEQMQTVIRRWINKVLPYSTGSYIQFLVINHNGKYKKDHMYTHIYVYICKLNHFLLYRD